MADLGRDKDSLDTSGSEKTTHSAEGKTPRSKKGKADSSRSSKSKGVSREDSKTRLKKESGRGGGEHLTAEHPPRDKTKRSKSSRSNTKKQDVPSSLDDKDASKRSKKLQRDRHSSKDLGKHKLIKESGKKDVEGGEKSDQEKKRFRKDDAEKDEKDQEAVEKEEEKGISRKNGRKSEGEGETDGSSTTETKAYPEKVEPVDIDRTDSASTTTSQAEVSPIPPEASTTSDPSQTPSETKAATQTPQIENTGDYSVGKKDSDDYLSHVPTISMERAKKPGRDRLTRVFSNPDINLNLDPYRTRSSSRIQQGGSDEAVATSDAETLEREILEADKELIQLQSLLRKKEQTLQSLEVCFFYFDFLRV